MDLKTTLAKLEELKTEMGKYGVEGGGYNRDRFADLYGELEDYISSVVGVREVKAERNANAANAVIYPNYIASGWLSGWTFHQDDGRVELIKVIAKTRAKINDPGAPEAPSSVAQLIRCLQRFRECCQYVENAPASEKAVQDIAWIMLRSQFDRVEREEMLPRLGIKAYKPDFGVPELRTLVEVKFIGEATRLPDIQEEILADLPGYVNISTAYSGVVVLVYDAAHKLRDARPFIEALRRQDGILEVIVVPGVG